MNCTFFPFIFEMCTQLYIHRIKHWLLVITKNSKFKQISFVQMCLIFISSSCHCTSYVRCAHLVLLLFVLFSIALEKEKNNDAGTSFTRFCFSINTRITSKQANAHKDTCSFSDSLHSVAQIQQPKAVEWIDND